LAVERRNLAMNRGGLVGRRIVEPADHVLAPIEQRLKLSVNLSCLGL
jgi:hypothetical protein